MSPASSPARSSAPAPAGAPAMAPGFTNPVFDSQRMFRHLLEAMSYPGRIVAVGALASAPAPLSPAAAAACLSLVDYETPVWLDAATQPARDWLRFHCGCPVIADPAKARFAVAADAASLLPLSAFDPGTDEYPDRSTTLIVEVAGLGSDGGLHLTGPGIRDETRLTVDGLPARVWDQWRENRVLFPGGVDLILTCGDRLAALPRTVKVEV